MSYPLDRCNSWQSTSGRQNWTMAIPSNTSNVTTILPPVQEVNAFYNHVAAHLNGVAKVLKPMLEINNAIIDHCLACKSVDHCSRGNYTLQEQQYGVTTDGDRRRCCDCNKKYNGRNLTADKSYDQSTIKSTFKPSTKATSSTKLLQSKKENNSSKLISSSSSLSRLGKLMGESSTRRYVEKSTDTHQTIDLKNCSICGINIHKVKVLALVPCKHLFCYSCLSQGEFNSCPKCAKSFKRETIKNITN